jgi:hypothetical protein
MPAVADEPKTAGRWWVSAVVVVTLALVPLVGHGCHGDDADHEPTAPPPVYNQR